MSEQLNNKTKAVTITLTPVEIEKGKELAKSVLGRSNLSGYIANIINSEHKTLKSNE